MCVEVGDHSPHTQASLSLESIVSMSKREARCSQFPVVVSVESSSPTYILVGWPGEPEMLWRTPGCTAGAKS